MTEKEIIEWAKMIRDTLPNYEKNTIDTSVNANIIPPFAGSEEIRLIIVGQNPTCQVIILR